MDIPKQIYEKHLKNGMTIHNIIKAYEEYSANDYEWQGVKDSTQYLYSLIEGDDALIDEALYDEFKDVEATVKSAISFIESDKAWSFFSFRGDSSRSPKWLFLDEKDIVFTDFSEIAEKLKIYLDKKKIIQRRWNEVGTSNEIKKIIRKLRLQEKKLLSWKKQRALITAKKILSSLLEKGSKYKTYTELINNLINLFDPETNDNSIIDYDKFAEMWLVILQPALDEKRKNQLRKRKIITLRDLTFKDVRLDEATLTSIYENCQIATTLDEMIASCIIAIQTE